MIVVISVVVVAPTTSVVVVFEAIKAVIFVDFVVQYNPKPTVSCLHPCLDRRGSSLMMTPRVWMVVEMLRK